MAKNNNKNDTFDLRIFPNGRVYFLDKDLLDEALEQNKEILICCNAWSGGYAIAVGADFQKDYYQDEEGWHDSYLMYSYDVRDEVFTPEDLQKFYKVIFTPGEMIQMKTGYQATSYQGGMFIDWDTKNADIIERREIDIYPKKFEGGAKEIDRLRKEVDSKATKNHFARSKDAEKKIRTLQAYGIIDKEKWF